MPRTNVKHARRERVLNDFVSDREIKTAGYNVSDKLALGLRAELGSAIANEFDRILQTGDFNSVDDETLGKIFDFLGAVDVARGDSGEQLFRDMESAMVDRGFWGTGKQSAFEEGVGYSHGPYNLDDEETIIAIVNSNEGWAVAEQLQSIIDGEEFEKQNLNALALIFKHIKNYLMKGNSDPGLEKMYEDLEVYMDDARDYL